jgi:hypothetical protein
MIVISRVINSDVRVSGGSTVEYVPGEEASLAASLVFGT